MRRLTAIAAFALLFSVQVWAQHGGGHAGGGFGGHGSFGGGGHFGGGQISGGMRSGSGVSHGYSSTSRGFSSSSLSSRAGREPYLHDGYRNDGSRESHSGRGHYRNHNRYSYRYGSYGYRNCYGGNCGGYGYGYPYWGWGYDPWLSNWGNSDAGYDNDYYQNLAAANDMNQQSLEEQQMFRQEQADGDQDAFAHSMPRTQTAPENQKQGDPILPPTVLIYRDQHKQQIQNYAIVGQTLWNFAPQHTQKIPLSDLDLPATVKTNEDQGVTFRVPSTGEGQ